MMAVELLRQLGKKNLTAIDCGCGAGSDIAYLRHNGFNVHAFDSEASSIEICSKRFKGDNKVFLSQQRFESFHYPQAELVVADASLFFCPPQEFDYVWTLIKSALIEDGIFCGSFLGPEDTMASAEYDRDAFWPDILTFTEVELKAQFHGFELIEFKEHKLSGKTSDQKDHNWHIYSVLARKRYS